MGLRERVLDWVKDLAVDAGSARGRRESFADPGSH